MKAGNFRKVFKDIWKDRELVVMSMPVLLMLIMFKFVPLYGLTLAFKDFNVKGGLFGSPWCGLENFKFLFLSGGTFWRITRNTLLYYVLFTVIGTIANVFLAIGINELVFKRMGKVMQSVMILPTFISYIAVTYVVSALLDSRTGMITHMIEKSGGKAPNFYLQASLWPLILVIVKLWKDMGYGSVIYLSALAGIDQEMYEAAAIDGANAWQKLRYITLPSLYPLITVMTLLSMGSMMHSDTGLFYQVTKNVGALYPTTQVVDSYILNAMFNSGTDYGITGAVTLYQSIVGFVMIVGTNLAVRKISPENSLF